MDYFHYLHMEDIEKSVRPHYHRPRETQQPADRNLLDIWFSPSRFVPCSPVKKTPEEKPSETIKPTPEDKSSGT